MVSTGEGHLGLPFGFSVSLMVWGNSLMWQGDLHEETRGCPGRRGFNPTRIGLQLQEFTLVVHEMDYLVEKFHGELGINIH